MPRARGGCGRPGPGVAAGAAVAAPWAVVAGDTVSASATAGGVVVVGAAAGGDQGTGRLVCRHQGAVGLPACGAESSISGGMPAGMGGDG